MAFRQGHRPDGKTFFGQAGSQRGRTLAAGPICVKHQHDFSYVFVSQVLQQRRREPLGPAQRQSVGKPGLLHREGIKDALDQVDAGNTASRYGRKNPGPVAGAVSMRHFRTGQNGTPIEAGDAVVAVAQRKHDAPRKELLSPLVENAHLLQQPALLGVGDRK